MKPAKGSHAAGAVVSAVEHCSIRLLCDRAVIGDYAGDRCPGRPFGEAVVALTKKIFAELNTSGGHRREHDARALLAAARRLPGLRAPRGGVPSLLGLAARYVSGYLETEPPARQTASRGRRRVARLGRQASCPV